ncbi:MAG: protein-glutamate O-methyltransferase CheR [Leptospirales bacterium]|nr:protein-glutamate O-methyltransferase CheR [Leptospirales bacterium]
MHYDLKSMTDGEFRKFSDFIYEETGINMTDGKNILLSNRIKKRLNALRLDSYTKYYDYLHGLRGIEKDAELEQFFDVVSTHETSFFRHENNFSALSNVCFREIIETKPFRQLKIWSAACSTGEEPYSIAMCLLDRIELFRGWHLEVLATDISMPVIETAKKGRYSGRRIAKVPPHFLDIYFDKDKETPGTFVVKDEVKRLVRFSRLNFFSDPFPGNVDIIFCRNVMIYFDRKHQEYLVNEFSKVINNPGFLFLGHAETLNGIPCNFKYRKILESPVYVPMGVE